MAKIYVIEVTRTAYAKKTIEVEADTQEEANEAALKEAANVDFGSGYDADYDIL